MGAALALSLTRSFRCKGMDAVSAVREAVRLRARPMLLTQLTTLLVLIPAALGIGDGPQLLQPLGIAGQIKHNYSNKTTQLTDAGVKALGNEGRYTGRERYSAVMRWQRLASSRKSRNRSARHETRITVF